MCDKVKRPALRDRRPLCVYDISLRVNGRVEARDTSGCNVYHYYHHYIIIVISAKRGK